MATNLGVSLFESKKGSDVVFVTEGEEIPAHRVVLSVCCQYFDTMLFGATNEAKMDRIELHETPAKQFKQIVRYCYLRSLEVNDWDEHELLKLLTLAHEYQFEDLMNFVELELREKHIKVDTIDVIFTYSTRLERANLVQNCLTFAEQHVEEVLQEDHFLSYSAALLSSMLERESFANYDQDRILAKIGKWKVCRSSDELKWILKKVNWSSASRGILVKMILEFIDKADSTQLHFWDALTIEQVGPLVEGSLTKQQTHSSHSLSGRSSAKLGNNSELEQKTGQLSCFSSTVDITQDLERLTGEPKQLFFEEEISLNNQVEQKFGKERGSFIVCLVDTGVRMKFPDQNVSLEEVYFEVGPHIYKEIKHVRCNGAEHEVTRVRLNGWIGVKFVPSSKIEIAAGQWLKVVLSQKLRHLDVYDLTVRGEFI